MAQAQRKFDRPFTPDSAKPVIYNTGNELRIERLLAYDNYGNTAGTDLTANDRKVLGGIEYEKKSRGSGRISNSAYRSTYTYQVDRNTLRTANMASGTLGTSSVTYPGKTEVLFTPAFQIPSNFYHAMVRLNLYLTMAIPYV